MAKKEGRIRFHYGFYAAMKVEYDLMHADVTYEQEIQLGEKLPEGFAQVLRA